MGGNVKLAILEKEILVGISGRNVKHYEDKGYEISRGMDKRGKLRIHRGTKILVKIEDLLEGSKISLTKICDDCKKHSVNIKFTDIINQRNKGDGKDRCRKCTGKRVNQTNCLWTTHPEVAKLLKNKQRGYEITYGYAEKEEFVCDKCGYDKIKKSTNKVVHRGLSCPRCSDGLSYPEKFMFSFLNQLNINFETQKMFNWSKNIGHTKVRLSGSKKYDFYIPSLNCIIETHGGQHYLENKYSSIGDNSLHDEQENDRLKERLAKENEIENYITIDCRYSELEWIKNNIYKSKLNKYYDLSAIDWNKCHEFACNSLVKVVCALWNEKINDTKEIAKITELSRSTVTRYLKNGAKFKWCDYNPRENRGFLIETKQIIQLSIDGEFIAEWDSLVEASKQLNIHISKISMVCKGKRGKTGGFKWIYKEDYDQYIIQLKINQTQEVIH
jgi:hypothetical protein